MNRILSLLNVHPAKNADAELEPGDGKIGNGLYEEL
jgi:hypothetical protein